MITPHPDFWKVFKETNGALSTAEALAIMNIAAQAPINVIGGLHYEFGSFNGKSAMSAMVGLKGGRFMLVDPIFSDQQVFNKVLKGVFDCNDFNNNKVETIGVGLTDGYSLDILPTINNVSFLFLDTGSHGGGLPMAEVKLIEDKIVKDGIVCFHDYKNQFTEVEGAFDYLVGTCKYDPIEINWQEIFDYVAEHNLEEGNNSWHIYEDLPHPPNFVGALRRK